MQGTVRQINRSNGGLPKLPVEGLVRIDAEGVAGDRHLDLRHHGGPFKAILMIAEEVIDDLAQQGFTVYPGAMGENFTVQGMDRALWRSGQQYQIGDEILIELTTLRQPCANLFPYGRRIGEELYDARCKAGDITSPQWAKGGFYAQVLRGGMVVAGAPVRLISDIS